MSERDRYCQLETCSLLPINHQQVWGVLSWEIFLATSFKQENYGWQIKKKIVSRKPVLIFQSTIAECKLLLESRWRKEFTIHMVYIDSISHFHFHSYFIFRPWKFSRLQPLILFLSFNHVLGIFNEEMWMNDIFVFVKFQDYSSVFREDKVFRKIKFRAKLSVIFSSQQISTSALNGSCLEDMKLEVIQWQLKIKLIYLAVFVPKSLV